jgi:hypothetical protein
MSLIHVAVIEEASNQNMHIEFELSDSNSIETFSLLFGITIEALYAIPVKRGIREFTDDEGFRILVGENFQNVCCVAAERIGLAA